MHKPLDRKPVVEILLREISAALLGVPSLLKLPSPGLFDSLFLGGKGLCEAAGSYKIPTVGAMRKVQNVSPVRITSKLNLIASANLT